MVGSTGSEVSGSGASSIRNVCIVAHINAGKTTLAERILFDSGRQRSCGDVDAGTTTMDSLREEQERGISIAPGVSRLPWRGRTIQLIDTPGHVDFAAEVLRSLRAADGAVVVVDGVRGVEPQTEAVWRLLDEAGLPRVVFVNKLDRATADPDVALDSLRAHFHGLQFVVMSDVLRDAGELVGLVDVLGRRALSYAAGGAAVEEEQLREAYADLVASVAEVDPEVMGWFCDGVDVAPSQLLHRVRAATQAGRLVPVLMGSALENRGVDLLLEAVCALLPSPVEGRHHGLGGRDDQPFVGLAFRSEFSSFSDSDRGESLVRVFQGQLAVGQDVECAADGRRFPVEALFDPHGASRAPVRRAGVGEIVAVPSPWLLRTGETLRAPGTDAELESIDFPDAVLSVQLEARSESGVGPLRRGAELLAEADPTLRCRLDPIDGTVRLFGMGELHLEIVVQRLRELVGGDLRQGRIRVEHFETVEGAGEGDAAVERSLGSRVLRASARVSVEPRSGGGTPLLRWAVPDALSSEFREALSASLVGAAERAGRHGEGLRDLAISLLGVECDVGQEGAMALAEEAAELALSRSLDAAGRWSLEPWVDVTVRVPPDHLSVVVADLNARSAELRDVVNGEVLAEARAGLPLERMVGYATELRSATRGKGWFELVLSGLRRTGGGSDPAPEAPKKTPGPP